MGDHTWTSTWHIAAPLPVVWQAILHPEEWPRWWPFVAEVQLLKPGNEDGVGALRRFTWNTRLPYRIHIVMEARAVEHHRLLAARATGDVRGLGIWRFSAVGCSTRLEYQWHIKLDRPWMRWLAPVATPLFKWNHDRVMDAGAAGLARYLDVREPPRASGH